jgi:hypothetical protein
MPADDPASTVDAATFFALTRRRRPRPSPETFLAAVRTALRGDPELLAMTRGQVWKDVAPPSVPYPLVVVAESSRVPLFSTVDGDGDIPFVERVTYMLTAYSQVAATAEAVAARMIKVIENADLTTAEGVVLENQHGGGFRTLRSPGGAGYGGSIVFQVVVPYEAAIQKFQPPGV